MGDIIATNSSVSKSPISKEGAFPEPTFERVRGKPNAVWKRIHGSDFFRNALQVGVGIFAGVTLTAVILPASILLVAISAIGLIALGLTSPA
ncbi:MAG TPA: hypothetical protein VGP47_01000, partial [Parachlamydiaceae bacterium]|nr:hypothetical protein [Parachlamydiaceae bacterium]